MSSPSLVDVHVTGRRKHVLGPVDAHKHHRALVHDCCLLMIQEPHSFVHDDWDVSKQQLLPMRAHAIAKAEVRDHANFRACMSSGNELPRERTVGERVHCEIESCFRVLGQLQEASQVRDRVPVRSRTRQNFSALQKYPVE